MSLTILSVAYPLAPVGPDAVGGSEQVLSQLDRALVAAGHTSLVVACEGSVTAGRLYETPAVPDSIDSGVIARAWEPQRARIAEALAENAVDLVHLHGFDFHAYVPETAVPVLATLHLPPSWYPRAALRPQRPDIWLHCVSRSQHLACPPDVRLLPPINNGVDVDALQTGPNLPRGEHALVLGRICPEKGIAQALDAAHAADCDLLLGGRVFPYHDHQRYFDEEVTPRLDARRRFLGPLGFARKVELLASARCLLVPSLADETSSLVAMEAIACGTPVIAFASGALPEVVSHGVTGFIVRNAEDMAAMIPRADALDRRLIRTEARRRFRVETMTARYLALYRQLAARAEDGFAKAALRGDVGAA